MNFLCAFRKHPTKTPLMKPRNFCMPRVLCKHTNYYIPNLSHISKIPYIHCMNLVYYKSDPENRYQYNGKAAAAHDTRILFSDIDGDGQIDVSANSPEVLQTLSYYPFGMTIEGMNQSDKSDPKLRYLYNGKEAEPNSRMYDYGARWYMPDIGRWGVVDPRAEVAFQMTPYHYCSNNPINRIDPDGLTDYEINRDGKITKVEGTETDDGVDRLIRGQARYKNGELRGREGKKFISIDKQVFDDLESGELAQSFNMPSGDEAEKLFDFIVGYVGVEFGKADLVYGSGEEVSFFLTSYSAYEIAPMTEVLEGKKEQDPGLKLKSLIHNHPDTGDENMVSSYGPSGVPGGQRGDIPQAARLNRVYRGQASMPKYFIWRFGRRTEYNENGPIR